MKNTLNKLSNKLRNFLKNPILSLIVGIVMLLSSFAGQQGSLYYDLITFNWNVSHGVHIMGIWHILQALPNLYDSLDWILGKGDND